MAYSAPNLKPAEAIQQFYENINEQRCEAAISLRPDYTTQRCELISEAAIHDVETVFNNGSDAVTLISIDIYTKDAKSYFSGYVRLEKHTDTWKIVGPYKSESSYTLAEYVNDYLPQTNTEVALETPISTKSTPLTPPKEVSMVKQRYLSGAVEISGNYTRILNELREQLPQAASGQIILVDRSRLSLYAYDKSNLLLGFYPLLSSMTGQIPSGVFQVVDFTKTESNENMPVHLNHLQPVDDTANNIADNYYLRDVLDNDTERSLLLSPIDLGKLRTLLSENTVLYFGN